MKRLFKVCHKRTKQPWQVEGSHIIYFDNKAMAKVLRNGANERFKGTFVVKRGPDHIRGETF